MSRKGFAVSLIVLLLSGPAALAVRPDAVTVIASQGGQQVTMGDVDEIVERVPEQEQAHFIDSPKRIQSLLTNLLLQKQLAAEAHKAGLDDKPEIAAATGQERTKLLAQAQLAHFRETLKLPDFAALAQEEYIAHKEKYVVPQTDDVQRVLISTASRSDDEAKALADSVAAEAKAAPGQFDALVEKYSDEVGKAETKGLIRDAAKRALDPELAAAIRALPAAGDVSAAVKTERGYHVLKLAARTPAKQQSYDEVREQIVTSLSNDYVNKAVQTHVDELRNNPLDANPDLVASLRTRYGVVQRSAEPASADSSATPAASKPATKPAGKGTPASKKR